MSKILLLILLPSFIFANNTEFEALRANHLGKIAADSFIAEMLPKSAKTLLGTKIKGEYVVEVRYSTQRGVEFLVKGTDPFYERALVSYETYINMMLLPISSTLSYERLQNRFVIKKIKDNQFSLRYKRGDQDVHYILNVGELGLVDKILYEEDNKKIFAVDIDWERVKDQYVPMNIKTISFEKTRVVGSFGLQNVILGE